MLQTNYNGSDFTLRDSTQRGGRTQRRVTELDASRGKRPRRGLTGHDRRASERFQPSTGNSATKNNSKHRKASGPEGFPGGVFPQRKATGKLTASACARGRCSFLVWARVCSTFNRNTVQRSCDSGEELICHTQGIYSITAGEDSRRRKPRRRADSSPLHQRGAKGGRLQAP